MNGRIVCCCPDKISLRQHYQPFLLILHQYFDFLLMAGHQDWEGWGSKCSRRRCQRSLHCYHAGGKKFMAPTAIICWLKTFYGLHCYHADGTHKAIHASLHPFLRWYNVPCIVSFTIPPTHDPWFHPSIHPWFHNLGAEHCRLPSRLHCLHWAAEQPHHVVCW